MTPEEEARRDWAYKLAREAEEAIDRHNERYGNRGGLESRSDRENQAARDHQRDENDPSKKEK
jgi:hypothetical protein